MFQSIPFKKDDCLVMGNINSRNYAAINDLVNEFNLNIRVTGGWNKNLSEQITDITDNEILVRDSFKEMLKLIPENRRPHKVILFSENGVKSFGEINTIIESKTEFGTIDTIVLLLCASGDELLQNLNKDILKQVYEINKECRQRNIKFITLPVYMLNYRFAYLCTDAENMPWFYEKLDPDLEEALQKNKLTGGAFLDLGAGSGNQAVEISKRGFEVTATDLYGYAFEKTALRERNINFIEDDVLHSKLTKRFDYIFDRGCFHSFNSEDWPLYIDNITKLLKDKGILYLKCFSKENNILNTFHPNVFSAEDIRNIFGKYFDIEEIKNTTYQENCTNIYPAALFAILQKKNQSIRQPDPAGA